MAVADYSTTPSINVSISGINVGEGCAPANINNAIRQMMADIKAYESTQIPFTPAGGIAAATVQEAILEAKTDAIAAIPGNATTSAAGLMSSADKTKLNGIATGATANAGLAQSAWNTGTNTTESLISPEKLEAKIALEAFAVGQTWQIVSRTAGTNYRNTTGKPIMVVIDSTGSNTALYVGTTSPANIRIAYNQSSGAGPLESMSISAIIPDDHYYRITGGFGDVAELR